MISVLEYIKWRATVFHFPFENLTTELFDLVRIYCIAQKYLFSGQGIKKNRLLQQFFDSLNISGFGYYEKHKLMTLEVSFQTTSWFVSRQFECGISNN